MVCQISLEAMMASAGVCVVVGVGPGIGQAVARRFGREGYSLGLIARKKESLAGCTTGNRRGSNCDLIGR